MSRSGYSDDYNGWELVRWRGAVASSIRGRRGQAFLREMLDALNAMPDKRLIRSELQSESGEVCALGSVGLKRGADMTALDPEDYESVAQFFGIPPTLVREIEFENDEFWDLRTESPEARWCRVRDWVRARLKTP